MHVAAQTLDATPGLPTLPRRVCTRYTLKVLAAKNHLFGLPGHAVHCVGVVVSACWECSGGAMPAEEALGFCLSFLAQLPPVPMCVCRPSFPLMCTAPLRDSLA
jgi:hypothetical protein